MISTNSTSPINTAPAASLFTDRSLNQLLNRCCSRYILSTDGNYTILVLDEEVGDYNKAVQFFVEYFKTIDQG